ncbi:MAG: hypothetical protein KatS3mg059_1662 [Thermomicrobiales bacterium]|nr:MAG: hypothetical protein KatS3mg059_1662 [Thermomicrobiales bacterium]
MNRSAAPAIPFLRVSAEPLRAGDSVPLALVLVSEILQSWQAGASSRPISASTTSRCTSQEAAKMINSEEGGPAKRNAGRDGHDPGRNNPPGNTPPHR